MALVLLQLPVQTFDLFVLLSDTLTVSLIFCDQVLQFALLVAQLQVCVHAVL